MVSAVRYSRTRTSRDPQNPESRARLNVVGGLRIGGSGRRTQRVATNVVSAWEPGALRALGSLGCAYGACYGGRSALAIYDAPSLGEGLYLLTFEKKL